MLRERRRSLAFVVAALLSSMALFPAGCDDPEATTRVLVRVESDLSPGDVLTKVRLRIARPDGTGETFDRTYGVVEDSPGDGEVVLPLTLAVEQGELDQFLVVATALGKLADAERDGPLVIHRALGSFEPGRPRSLRLFLGAACIGVDCDITAGLTCHAQAGADIGGGECINVTDESGSDARDLDAGPQEVNRDADAPEAAQHEGGADPCDDDHGGCDALASCTSTQGSAQCTCPEGSEDTLGNGTLCEVVDCGPPAASTPLSVATPDGTEVGATAQYTCLSGYMLEGPVQRICGTRGWAGNDPYCAPVDCGTLSMPDNGSVTTPSGTTFGQHASYGCAQGYGLVGGDPTRQCGADAQWDGSAPTCADVNACAGGSTCAAAYPCSDLPAPSVYYTCRGQMVDWSPVDSPSSFVDNDDGTVSDTRTGRVWQVQVEPDTRTAQEAIAYCASVDTSLPGTGWRVPTRAELYSIVDFTRRDPAIDTSFFPATPSAAFVTVEGTTINFYSGAAGGSSGQVRCVKGGD